MTSTFEQPLKTKAPHGKHPNTLKNLEKGRARLVEMRRNGELTNPDGYSLASALKHSLNKPIQKPTKDAPTRDHIVYSTIEGAILREPTPFKELWDRIEGKVPEKHAIVGDIVIRIVDDDSDIPQLAEGGNE